MKTVPFAEFRRDASRYLDLVQAGEVIVITRNGRPVARLVEVREGIREPRWKEPVRPVAPRSGRSARLAQAVSEDRGERG